MELSELRIKLDQMTERTVSRLKDRSRFPLNEQIYQINAIPIEGKRDVSFLEYAIEGLERYHATLGRFKHPDQHPMTGHLPKTRIKVETDESPISKVKINIKEDMLTFYTSALERLCKPGNNPNKYGETAYVDADLLSMMNERINLGRYVAESKLKSDPTLIKIQSDEEIVAKLRNQQREDEVVAKARKVAANYELDQDAVENFFRWMIDETVKVELSYVKQKR